MGVTLWGEWERVRQKTFCTYKRKENISFLGEKGEEPRTRGIA